MITETKCDKCKGSGQVWLKRGTTLASVTCGECNGTGVRLQSEVEPEIIPTPKLKPDGIVKVKATKGELPKPSFDLEDN